MRGSCSGIYKSTALNPFYLNKNYRLCYRVTTSLSQIKEWCFPFHFTHELLLIHSEAHCLVPVQLKHNFLLDSVNPHSSISFTVCSQWLYAQISHEKHSLGAYNSYHLFDTHFHV